MSDIFDSERYLLEGRRPDGDWEHIRTANRFACRLLAGYQPLRTKFAAFRLRHNDGTLEEI